MRISSRFPFSFKTLISAGIELDFGAGVLLAATGAGLAGGFSSSSIAFVCIGAAPEGDGTTVNSGGRDGPGEPFALGVLPSIILAVTRSKRDCAVFEAISTRSPRDRKSVV